MNSANRERVKDLLSQASRLPRQERAAFIERASGADRQTAAEALDLLATLDDPGFMSAPTGAGIAAALPQTGVIGEGPGTRIDRYKLLQLIGEGGFGSVFMAEQTEPIHRKVALKIIKAGMDTKQVIARFESERQALALMDHPNIAKVLDAGATYSGRPYFVMELVRGEPVTRYCDRERLSVHRRLELFRDVCHAVQHAHQKGIIHRDLKPSNILVTVADGSPLPKVIDFGIAKATEARLTDKTLFTEMHQLIGTPEYMSPEQAEVSGVDIDTRSDIYALGVLLYELLAGTTPLEHGRLRSAPLAEIQRLIREEEPPRPSLRLATLASSTETSGFQTPLDAACALPGSSAIAIAQQRQTEPSLLTRTIRGDLDWIVMRCLEKDRRRRYDTAIALADDVDRFLRDQPVLATPPSRGYVLRKFVRRNRTAVLAGAVVAAVLLLGAIGTTVGFVWALREQSTSRRHANMARNEAERANREAEQARAVTEFMTEVLASAKPGMQGAEVRLVEVLASASAAAPQRFADHPLLEAQVRDMLGQVYSSLSNWSDAKSEYAMALALLQEHADKDEPRTLTIGSRYVDTALQLNHLHEAEQLLVELVPKLERVFGPDDPRTLLARVKVAVSHLKRGRVDEAERLLLELRGYPHLADDDAFQWEILRSLLWITRHRSATDHKANLAPFIMSRSEPLAREANARTTRLYGADSAAAQLTRLWLAEILCDKGELTETVELCRSILADSADRLGECHDVRVGSFYVLSEALARLGEEKEPAELQRKMLDCHRAQSPGDLIGRVSGLCEALPYFERAGLAVEGEALAREAADALRTLGDGHGSVSPKTDAYLATFLSMQDRSDEAEVIFRSMLANEPQVRRFTRATLHLFYAGHLTRRGAFPQAETHLARAVELVGDVRTGTRETHPDDIILGFITLYDQWGRKEQADEYRRLRAQLLAPRQRADDPEE